MRPCGWETGWRAIVGQTGVLEGGTEIAERPKERIRSGGTEIFKKNNRKFGATLLQLQVKVVVVIIEHVIQRQQLIRFVRYR